MCYTFSPLKVLLVEKRYYSLKSKHVLNLKNPGSRGILKNTGIRAWVLFLLPMPVKVHAIWTAGVQNKLFEVVTV
jgi:hypothetical protein